MSKNSVDAYKAEGKTNLLMFDPDKLTIVSNPNHPLFDRRADLPVDEAMVANIEHQGVIQPIVVVKNPETGEVEVAAGRQRVKATREANRRRRERGVEPIMVPGVVRRSVGAALTEIMASENAIRRNESPLDRAEKMQRLLDMGRPMEAVAVVFGCTEVTVKNTVSLLDATAAVKKAVEEGVIPVNAAVKLVKLEPEEQRAKIEEIKAGTAAGETNHQKARRVAEAVGGPKLRGKKEIRGRLDDEGLSPDYVAALRWVLGEEG